MKFVTSFDYPPIPIRSMDWSAVDADTYDCDCDQDGFFSTCPIGRGSTEAEAIADLIEQLDDRVDPPCKNTSPECDVRGECLRCNAESGEVCREAAP
jgi:hypothetical protein